MLWVAVPILTMTNVASATPFVRETVMVAPTTTFEAERVDMVGRGATAPVEVNRYGGEKI